VDIKKEVSGFEKIENHVSGKFDLPKMTREPERFGTRHLRKNSGRKGSFWGNLQKI